MTVTFRALVHGEAALGLPAIGGLFDTDQCSHLDAAELENRYLLAAAFELGWFRADGSLSRVNYRDMGPEELGSVYESLLELVPDVQGLAHAGTARLSSLDDPASTHQLLAAQFAGLIGLLQCGLYLGIVVAGPTIMRAAFRGTCPFSTATTSLSSPWRSSVRMPWT